MNRSDFSNSPRANRDLSEIKHRRAALNLPHMLPLAGYVARLRDQYPSAEIPDFDPLGGGIEASLLFLLEKPGPQTSLKGGGSGFISVCNNDPTAEATWRFLEEASIPVETTIMWNAIPMWDGARAYRSADVANGVAHLDELLDLLPRVTTVLTLGIPARKAAPIIARRGLRHIASDHPGPLVRARWPERWARIPEVWKGALREIQSR